MSTIELQNLTKSFGDLTAVNNVSLKVDENEVLCLLGPSGCGKTTTLRMVAGLEIATSGNILIDNKNVNELETRDRNLAMAFQFYALYPSLTVGENLANPLYAENLSEKEIKEKIFEIADILQLREIINRKPHQLAEGEKQRVAVGRAIIRDPQCFLFDEPLSRLDVQLREQMRGQIKEVLSDLNKATVIVTHDQLEALTMATKIAVMRDGLIEQISSPHDIFAKPENTFVAGFIGTPQMNIADCNISNINSSVLEISLLNQKIEIDFGKALDINKNENYFFGVRPRSFDLAETATNQSLSGEVDLIENMGSEVLLHVNSNDASFRTVQSRSHKIKVGDKIHLKPKKSQVHLFNSDGKVVAHG
jgi:multiple sugar transport system ATP-binding protein